MCFVALKKKKEDSSLHPHFLLFWNKKEKKPQPYTSFSIPSPSQTELGLAHSSSAGPAASQGFCAAHG